MLEIKDEKSAHGFAREMDELQKQTEIRIVEICQKYELDPLQTIKIFGLQMINTAAELKIRIENKFGNGGNE